MGFAFQRHPTVLQRLQHLPEDDLVVMTIITFGEETRMDLDAFRQPLQCLFQQHPVRLTYLFGSQATRRTHSSSDVDVAVLLDESLTPDERFVERLRLLGDLSRIFDTDDVDLVILNEAPPLLAYETLRHGILLYCADAQTRIEFQVRTLRAYEDTMPLRRVLSEAMVARLKAGTFGQPVLTQHRGK
jgi:predicted nucleotidyltransferase